MGKPPTDGELLKQFTRAGHGVPQGDDASFQKLLNRHARMVFQVCFRVLGNSADAEDAAQAVFLTLAQRAHDFSLQRSTSLGGWLHTLAWRVAMRLRSAASLRQKHEKEAHAVNTSGESGGAAAEFQWEKLRPLLDEALSDLPEKYRLPFVLCHLEERSHDEAAALLGTPKRTVTDRLERARELLRKRLEKRGVVMSVGILATLAAAQVGGAELPGTFCATTVKVASLVFAGHLAAGGLVSGQSAALMHHASRVLLWAKVKAAAMIAIAVGVVASASVFSYVTLAAKTAPNIARPSPVAVQARARPAMKPEEVPDEKPKANAELMIVPREAIASELFKELREKGVKVLRLGTQPKSYNPDLFVPPELRFKSVPVTELVQAIAATKGFKVSWMKDGKVAILYTGEPDAEFERARKELESAEAAVRRDAAWRIGDMPDVRAIPILLSLTKDFDAEVARLAVVGLRRMGWGVVGEFDDRASAWFTADVDSRNSYVREHLGNALADFDADQTKSVIDKLLAIDINARNPGLENVLTDPHDVRSFELMVRLDEGAFGQPKSAYIRALGFNRGKHSLAMIESALKESDPYLQELAVEALYRCMGEEARPRFEAFLSDSRNSVRKAAAKVLGSIGNAGSVAWLEKAIASSDVDIRKGALEALGKTGGANANDVLDKAASDPDADVRRSVASALGRLGGEKAIGTLERMLGDAQAVVRGKALDGLSNIGGDRVPEWAEKMLGDSAEEVRANAFWALRNCGSPKALPVLEKLLEHRDKNFRDAAVDALICIDAAHARDVMEQTFIKWKFDKKSIDLADNAISHVSGPEWVPFIENFQKWADLDIRRQLNFAAVDTGGRNALPLLTKYASDKDEDVRWAACGALKDVDGPQASALLENELSDVYRDASRGAAESLGLLGGPEAERILDKGFLSPNISVRKAAIYGISWLGGTKALARLEEAFDDPVPEVRYAAASSILTTGCPEAVTLLMKAVNHPDASVRAGAIYAFHEIGNSTKLDEIGLSKLPGLFEQGIVITNTEARAGIVLAIRDTILHGDKAIPILEKAIYDPEWSVRADAADVMDMFDGPYYLGRDSRRKEEFKTKVLTLLEQALGDEHWEVRGKAVGTLSGFSGEHAFQLFTRGFSDTHAGVREQAAYYAGKHNLSTTVSLLEKALADPVAKVRAAAAESLGKLGGDTSVTPLLATLKDEKDYNAQKHILAALKNRFGKSPGVQEAINATPLIPKPLPKSVKPPTAPPDDKF